MTVNKLEQAVGEIQNRREDVIDKLLQFASTDSLLFWGNNEELVKKQEQLWRPVLSWANEEINAKYVTTKGLDVPEQDEYSINNLKNFMENLSDKELAAFYLAAVNMKSELLAAALVKGHINAEQAFNAANLEELWQAEHWGKESASEQKRQDLKKELHDIEQFLRQ